ncbi:MAG TPA: SRPBCC family protein [Roseiarcus sp.]|nr:SRPBCC family protein [Roseiarcus sp.]
MASIRKELQLDADAADVWAALADFGAVDKRVAPGFVVSSQLDGDRRSVKFANGVEAVETLVSRDDETRRLVYAIIGGRMAHYNAALQVFAEGPDRSRLVWTIDLLPNDFAAYIGDQMETACKAMKPTLEGQAA